MVPLERTESEVRVDKLGMATGPLSPAEVCPCWNKMRSLVEAEEPRRIEGREQNNDGGLVVAVVATYLLK